MNFTPLQIGITFSSFFITLLIAWFWHKKDKQAENKASDVESFPVLMSVFFWAAFLMIAQKMLVDLGVYYSPSTMAHPAMKYIVVAGEEFVKVFALLVGLNIAGKRFNELSDGVMYAVFAALGFIFAENIFYLLSVDPNWGDFLITLMGRNIFSFGAHLSVIIFGMYYATAYLRTSKELTSYLKKKKVSRIAPYNIFRILKFLFDKYHLFFIIYIPLSPFILFFQMIQKHKTHVTMSEMLVGGFLSSVYLHALYNSLLGISPLINTLALSSMGLFVVFLYHFFPDIDVH